MSKGCKLAFFIRYRKQYITTLYMGRPSSSPPPYSAPASTLFQYR